MVSGERLLDLIGLLIVVGLVFGIGTLLFLGGTGPPVPGSGPPDANWSVARLNATHVQVGHVGGESVDGDELELLVDGESRPIPWSGQVAEGDVATVRAPNGSRVELRWTGGGDPVSYGEWTP